MLRNHGDVTFAKGDRKDGKGAGGSAAVAGGNEEWTKLQTFQ